MYSQTWDATSPSLDNHDSRMVRETLNGTYSTTGHYTHEKGLIDRESDSEGFGQLNITTASRPSNWDTDKDGMPDWWEKAYGTNPNVADNNGDINGDGYTNLEDYLNWCADPHFTMKGKIEVNLSSYFAGYTRPSYRVSYTANGAVAAVSGNKAHRIQWLRQGPVFRKGDRFAGWRFAYPQL